MTTPGQSVLLTYATTHGHTTKIASKLAESLESDGLTVDLKDVSTDPVSSLDPYGSVIVAASLHVGGHQKDMLKWAKAHASDLATRPNAFISVSLTAADNTDEARETTAECIEKFVDETGWQPNRREAIAGAIQYREYDPFTRVLMRLIMKKGGHPTDTSHDYDFTDWEAVERLGHELALEFRPDQNSG